MPAPACRRVAPSWLAAIVATLAVAPVARAADAVLYRPMMADLRESLIHLRVCSFTQDFRYGSDVTDSTSNGGWQLGVTGVSFDVGAGKVFRAPVWRGMFGWKGPWQGYQLVASALLSTNFDRIDAEFVTDTDYQFGGGIEMQWTGACDPEHGTFGFDATVVSTRTVLQHRSSHVGDEYIGRSNFGRNQTGPGAAPGLNPYPPVKRTALSYEVLQQFVALEGAPGLLRGGTLRGYAGIEAKIGISGLKPPGFQSPAAQFGFEYRSDGNRVDVPPDPFSAMVNRWLGQPALSTAWVAAFDLRLMRPFDFARSDNPDGAGEVWTPSLWTPSDYGREFEHYAGSWHGMVGVALFSPRSRDESRGGRRVGNETWVTLDWYRGYSPHGPFLDSKRRDHPRWYVVPGLTMHF